MKKQRVITHQISRFQRCGMRPRLLIIVATVCSYRSLRGVNCFSRFRLGNVVVGERRSTVIISPLRPLHDSNAAEVDLKEQQQRPYKRLHPVTGRSSTHKIFTEETLRRVNSKARLTELFKAKLSKGDVNISGGGRALSHCPFHNDRTPSCSIDDNLGVYHCFGCGASGNAIKFIMEADGVSFRNAVEQLASETGVDIEYSRPAVNDAVAKREQEQLDSIYVALEKAALFYTRCLSLLPQGGKARSYLSDRGISARTTVDFLLGFSPTEMASSSSDASPSRRSPMVAHLQNECGLDEKTLILAGLISSKNVSLDKMHGRLVMPIRDHRGVVIGFGGRYIDADREKKQKELSEKGGRIHYCPKYLNSPQTKLFKKNEIVFGLDRAKSSIRRNDCGLVVEGYFDVIALHDRGITYAVASMGSSLTEEQLKLVSRFTPSKRIIICPDDDQAGYKAIERLCYIDPGRGRSTFADMTELGIDIRVASLSDMSSPTNIKSKDAAVDAGQLEDQQKPKSIVDDSPVLEVSSIKDPCDFVSTHGANVFEEHVIKKVVPWTDWYANRILAKYADWASDSGVCRNCVSELTTFFSLLPTCTDRTMHIYRYASVLSSGNHAARIQLESDLLTEVARKERKRNALRSRVENLKSEGIGIASNSSVERWQSSYGTSSSVANSNIENRKNRVEGYKATTRAPPSDSDVLNKLSRGEATGYNVNPVDGKATSIDEVSERQHFTWEDVLRAASKAAELATSDSQTRRGSDISRSWQRKNQRKVTAKGSSKRTGSLGKWGTWGDTNYEWLPYEDDNFYQHEIALASAELAILRLMICDATRRCELVTTLKDADIHFTAPKRQRLFDAIATLPMETKDMEGLNLSPYLEKCITTASGSTSGSNAEVTDTSKMLHNIIQDEENATHNQCCSKSGEQELQEAQLVLFRARAASMVSSMAQELYNVQKNIATIIATGKELHDGQLSALEAYRSVAFDKLHEVCVSTPIKKLADLVVLIDLLK